MGAPVLLASEVSKRFGPVKALDKVEFHLDPGEVHALLGINGAGKSTFIKILSGIVQKDSGTITVAGQEVHFRAPEDAIRAGIATVQQHPELVPDMTGYENIFLGRETHGRGMLGRVDQRGLIARAAALLQRFAVPIDLSRTVAQMSAVEREAVAILQALAADDIRVLILDEPTSTLTDVERDDLFRLMNILRDQGISMIYITHQLEEVFEIADSFSVFRGGRCVARMSIDDARAQGVSLATMMLGEAMGEVFPPKAAPGTAGEVILSVRGLSSGLDFADVQFDVRQGEILGVFGLVGSGCDELAKAIFGAQPAERGQILVNGEEVMPGSPRDALAAGIFLVPGDRRTEGLALTRTALFNIPLANLGRASGKGWVLRRRRIREDAQRMTAQVALHPPSLTIPASGYSGGNQQKIVLAKGLYAEADVYIFVEPTVGVDIGARAKIYALIRELAQSAAVIVMSSDCDEVHGIADRTLALHKGRQVEPAMGTFSRDQLLMGGIMGGAHP
ncbi:ribose transport system ATP-binding protein [Gemmobacter aquatilis]|uniref:Ribose transport system ATP-binding protein n=1 Tax=Gemmobacter aquatilis TaxID=933059 RepID=A0A1H7Y8B5_9RHOB|nr:sugar ABC transporter ATP-binding protein [Gemmobacter aquatilis]SEM42456.1 ribose transport system ATP-binding protein [Gemmobacter aquatilis]